MTIEEIKKASDELFKSFRCGKTYRMGFETGVMWSDEHLQVPKIISKSMKITREEAKELLPIVKAFAEGKVIEIFDDVLEWVETENPTFNLSPEFYRIKPEPKYRPFKTQEECWNEMLKHQPFGWIRNNDTQRLCNIGSIGRNNYGVVIDKSILYFDLAFNTCNFIDGTPFGIKEE